MALTLAGANLGGIGAEECWRCGADLAIDDGAIQRQVMPLNAPAPGAGLRRLAEDADEIPAGIADVGSALFEIVQNRLQAHDGDGLLEALIAGASAQEIEDGL